MTNPLFNALSRHAPWQQAVSALSKGQHVALYDATESQRAYLVAALAELTGRQVIYIVPSEQAAMRAAEDCAHLLMDARAALLPAQELQFIRAVRSRDTQWRRLTVLDQALSGQLRVLCLAADTLLSRMMPAQAYQGVATLRIGQEHDLQQLVIMLSDLGYERVDMVEGRGQFAVRGDLLDIFPPCLNDAVRVEFFDTQVDAIRSFDTLTQRSIAPLNEVRLTPATEYYVAPAHRKQAFAAMQQAIARGSQARSCMLDQYALPPEEEADIPPQAPLGLEQLMLDAQQLADTGHFTGIQEWVHLVLPQSVGLWALLPDAIIVVDTPDRVRARMEDRTTGFASDLEQAIAHGEATPDQQNLLFTADEVQSALQPRAVLTVQELLRGQLGLQTDLAIALKGVGASGYTSRYADLARDIADWQKQGWQITLLMGAATRAQRVRTALQEFSVYLSEPDTASGNLLLSSQSFSRGFVLEQAGLAVLTDTDIFGSERRRTRQRQYAGERIEAFTDLRVGDYVVHEHYGVGIYHGTVRLQSEGVFRDYLFIQYRGNDKLYIPVDQFDRVQKYIGSGGDAPPLNDLTGGDWERQKKKVKAGLQKLAIDLVKLYAARQTIPGYAFQPMEEWERQFAENFEYELTSDQERAIEETLNDMARPINMDRLLCGDVGYGKTEVAMRAALRCVLNGKQVAFLAPTTILVQQHYRTLSKRFGSFPVRVEYISRFRTPKQNREVIAAARAGEVDILIGTHRLLSKDVAFKNLGLLVVDEEQRFGVGHKERIKSMKGEVDVLTLSATPIPRTLHMSMVGVRDMSLLETPPEERFPVQTYVTDYQEPLIRDALMRELGRGGQVFFLYNRVRDIERFASRLRLLVPEARIGVAHGQMPDNTLEDIIMDFYEGAYDVLLCTTIIENGIDVPNANTLIVYDADHFGLSQLYQLRGRVGRSNRVAYAYFTVRPDRTLTETAEKRLSAIKEFTEFGAGFRIAMRDLEIRGAGNMFGPEQSGQVSAVGYDMYCKMIEEAVLEAKGDFSFLRERELETRVELRVTAFLPESYVKGEAQRMEVYKRIAMIRTQQDRMDVIDELIDRFGEPTEPVTNLISVAHLRSLARAIGADLVTSADEYLKLRLHADYVVDPQVLFTAMTSTDRRFSLSSGRQTSLLIKLPRMNDAQMLEAAIPLLTALIDAMNASQKAV